MSMDNEALFIIQGDGGAWRFTGAFRNGTADSILATDVGNPEEYAALPEHLRSACWPVDRPCVVLQTAALCALTEPHQVNALAQWLIAASIALEQCLEARDE